MKKQYATRFHRHEKARLIVGKRAGENKY